MSIKNKGNDNLNIEGDFNKLEVTNIYGVDETSSIVFDYNLLNEVLQILKQNLQEPLKSSVGAIPTRDILKKNKKNNMSNYYFENILCRDYLPYFQQIEDYFKNVNNKARLDDYNDICETINMQYAASKERFDKFEQFISFCYKAYFGSKSYKQEINAFCRILLHYMYWHCDIGENI